MSKLKKTVILLEMQFIRSFMKSDRCLVLLRRLIYNGLYRSAMFHIFLDIRGLVRLFFLCGSSDFREQQLGDFCAFDLSCIWFSALRSRTIWSGVLVYKFGVVLFYSNATSVNIPWSGELRQHFNQLRAIRKVFVKDLSFFLLIFL